MSDPQPLSPQQPPLSPGESDVRTWCMLCHLSALAGLFLPAGNILGPLLVWQIKKNEMPAVEPHGKDSLNFQLTVLIITLIAGAVAFIKGAPEQVLANCRQALR